jgi:multidrug resistance efflux pump
VPGRVDQVFVQEGTLVSAGTALLKLRNLDLESEAARARADLEVATARATQAELRYASFGAAERERQRLADRNRDLAAEMAKLQVVSPIAGVVVTSRLQDLAGSYIKEGAFLVEVNGLATMRARIFVPEVAIQYLHLGAPADMKLDSIFRPVAGRVVAIAPATAAMTEGLVPKEKYFEGFRQPQYYAAIIELPSNGFLRDGMPGTGKIQIRRRSLADFAWRVARDSVGRKLW